MKWLSQDAAEAIKTEQPRTIPEVIELFEGYAEHYEKEANKATDPQKQEFCRGKVEAYSSAALELLYNTKEGYTVK